MFSVYLLKILIIHLILSILIGRVGLKFLTGKEKIEVKGRLWGFSKSFGLILIIVGILTPLRLIIDLLFHDVWIVEITVKIINNPGVRSIIEEEVISEEGNTYSHMLSEFHIKEGNTYKVTYLKNTKIITNVFPVK